MKNQSYINIEKASENNLKDVSIKIPHHKITCFTGVSGSGKSSLVYDIICKESQRRYLESFSSYARQFFGKTSRPNIEKIEGLMPAISVDQKTVSRNPRSTVGTMSELYDYLRLLFARLGERSPDLLDVKLSRSLFSFNSPEGACSHCNGLGVEDRIDPDLLIKDHTKSLREGALKITTPSGYTIYSQVTIDVMQQVCQSEGFNVDIPWQELTDEQKHIVLNGSNKIKIPYGKHPLESRMRWSGITAKPREEGYYKGILPVMENILRVDRNPNILRFARTDKCSQCRGARLNNEALSVTFNKYNIAALNDFSIKRIKDFFSRIKFDKEHAEVGEMIRDSIISRCNVLLDLGLGYLTLSRESTTLSGSEAQRIRLATQVGNGLRGILYILDEPSIGLHPRDNERMIRIIKKLRDQGNTVLVVEHDDETMLYADQIVDIGPLAGKNGGEVLFQSEVKNLAHLNIPESKTLEYLKVEQNVSSNNVSNDSWLEIKGARLHNLKNIDTKFKLNGLNVVTGVSGAGKSTLVMNVLGDSLIKILNKESFETPFDEVKGNESIGKVIEIDQTPIGRTPRSNPATYVKVFDLIRRLFADIPGSKVKGWKQGHFSFNTKGGRCENCEGAGVIQTGMHFLGKVETTCETCNGKRFDDETLEIKYNGKNISEILDMEISEAVEFFKDEPKIHHYLKVMVELGLGYIHLGQPATTLSWGEAQRLKLAAELVKPANKHSLYIFDEPTTGLHNYDVRILLKALYKLIESGHTVVVIEHHQDIIKRATHVVDLGPEGGDAGGEVIFSGSPKDLMKCEKSFTGLALTDNRKIIDHTNDSKLEELINAPIGLKGVNTHNLKDIDVEIPRNKLTVITGVSGSGKSSLAFDSLFAEGQFRFTESFSTYARRLIQQKARPDIRESFGLTPTIAVDGRSVTRHPRATVGTVTSIYDLYRLLFSRVSENLGKEQPLSSIFSFNHEAGACPHCKGLGNILAADPHKMITHPDQSLIDGALQGSKPGKFYGDPFGQYVSILKAVGDKLKIDFSKSWNALTEEAIDIAMYGTGENEYDVKWEFKRKNRTGVHEFKSKWPGFAWYIEDEYRRKHESEKSKVLIDLMKEVPCPECNGARLKGESLEHKIDDRNIYEISVLEVKKAIDFFIKLDGKLNNQKFNESADLVKSIIERLGHLNRIGLGYLHMHRSTMTLSGGEARRLRLVAQLGGELTGITYVLDEPTIGLHSSDTQNLIHLLKNLAKDNTVVVVEHDEEVIREAEHLIELGPGAGEQGGEIIAHGSFDEVFSNEKSLVSKYLKEDFLLDIPKKSTLNIGIQIKNARANNLKDLDIDLPNNGIAVIHGVSGSGKSSLMFDVLSASGKYKKPIECDSITGLDQFESIIEMNQTPIGNNPNSTPATFLGLFDDIRTLFAETDEAKRRKLRKTHFSFNSKGGRCEACKGQGQVRISMDFLADVWVTCPECNGKRYTHEVLDVKWNAYSIAEVLELTISQALPIFQEIGNIEEAFELLIDLGLGHLKLGQASNTLSGGEAQRIKLAKELLTKAKGKCLYLLDEPTTGLHYYDVEKLLMVLNRIAERGHAVYIVEHHPWLIQYADYTVELGPKGGDEGGYLLSQGKNSD